MFSLRKLGDVSPIHARRYSDFSDLVRRASTSKGKTRRTARKLENLGRRLVKAAKNDNKVGRKYVYQNDDPHRRTRENVIARMKGISPSKEKAQFFAGHALENVTMDELLENTPSERQIQPGTFVEIRRNDIVTNGVVLTSAFTLEEHDTTTLTTTGEVWAHRASDVMFAVPNFVDQYLVQRCGMEEIHKDDHELAARLKVLKRARDFERAVEQVEHKVTLFIRNLYSEVRAASQDEWGKISTLEAAQRFDSNPESPIITLFAVHKQLMERSEQFQCQPSGHLAVHTFDVRPLSHLISLSTVKKWMRNRDPCIKAFQSKAQILLDLSRKITTDSMSEQPSPADDPVLSDMRWSPTDQQIIEVLRLSLGAVRSIQSNPYASITPYILKSAGIHGQDLSSGVTFKFLRDIGVYTPWEDLACKDRVLNLPHDLPDPEITSRPIPGLLSDPHESVRHDFGNLPVFVIDDFDADELDDGVSIEHIQNEPGNVWIHVHVADPTAFLPIEHDVAQHARRVGHTGYFLHRVWPMLPRQLVEKCDLGVGAKQALRVLTFSVKLNSRAEILDYTIRPGLVRNVHVLKYDDVDVVLGERATDYVISPFEPSISATSSIQHNRDVSHILPYADLLKALYKTARQNIQRRIDRGTFGYAFNNLELSVSPKPVPHNPSHPERPILYRGFPHIKYTVVSPRNKETGARSLVAECMKLACRVASLFAADHGIPLIRRAMPPVQIADKALHAKLLESRDATGFIDPVLAVKERVLFNAARPTLEPDGHWSMGIHEGEGGYSRATSPLRRFADMIAHWQLKSVLLPKSDPAYGRPPFSREDLWEFIQDFAIKEHAEKRAGKQHEKYWSHMFIQRWMDNRKRLQEQGKADESNFNPLRGLEAFVSRPLTIDLETKQPYLEVQIPRLGQVGLLIVERLDQALDLGETLTVKVKGVHTKNLSSRLHVELD